MSSPGHEEGVLRVQH